MTRLPELLDRGPEAINIGVADFAQSLREQGAVVVEIEWRPRLEVDPKLKQILDRIL